MKRGFTLLEVLFALGLFALVAVPLLQTQMLSGAALRRMERTRQAMAVASRELDDAEKLKLAADRHDRVDAFDVLVTSSRTSGTPVPLTRIQVQVSEEGQVYATLAAYKL